MISLVGRAHALADLDRCLADPDGTGFAVIVAGAGLGKTRLLDEFRRVAEPEFPQVVAITFPDHSLDALEPLRGLLRELGQGWVANDETLSPGERRWELASLLVDAAAAVDRVLVTVDDLQKAHDDALWVLGRLVTTSGSCAFVAATRDADRPTVEALLRQAMVVPLAPLTADEVARMLASTDVELATDDVMAITGGSPLLVTELLRGLDPATSGRTILRRRVDSLPTEVRRVLQVLAVAGDAPQAVTVAAAACSGSDFDHAMEAAARTGVVDGARFSHDLLRDALLDDLSPGDRHQLHIDVAAAWEPVGTVDAQIERLRHLLAAIPTSPASGPPPTVESLDLADGPDAEGADSVAPGHPDPTDAINAVTVIQEVLTLARWLVDVRRPEPAVELLRTALAVARDHLPGRVELQAAVLVTLADATFELGDGHASVALGSRACDLLADAGQPDTSPVELRAKAAIAATRVHDTIEPEPQAAVRVDQVLAALPEDDDPLRARLLGRAAVLAVTAMEVERGHRLADEGLAMARRLGDPELEVQLLADRYLCVVGRDDAEEREQLGPRIIGLAAAAGRSELARDGHQWIAGGRLARGDLPGAVAELDRFELRAAVRPDPRWQVAVDFRRMAILGMTGPRGEAIAFAMATFERFAEQLGEMERPGLEAEYRGCLVRLYGVDDPALPPLHDVLFGRPLPPVPFVSIRSGMLALVAADVEGLRPVVDRWAPRAADVVRSFMGLPTAAILAEMTAEVGDPDHCASVVAALEPFAGLLPTDNGIGVNPPVDTLVARNLVHLDRLDDAEASARDGVALATDTGAAPLLATALGTLVEIARRRGVETTALVARARDAASRGGVRLSALDGGRSAVPVRHGRMVRDGEVWRIDSPFGSVSVRHTLGTEQLSRVLDAGGRDVAAVELAGGFGPTVVTTDLGPALDATAKRAYRRRIVDLEADIEQAHRFNDVARAERARDELDQVMAELRRAVGLGGRDRPQRSGDERARVNVTRAIRRAIDAISTSAPALGAHLDVSIQTGRHCAYRPDPSAAVTWRVIR